MNKNDKKSKPNGYWNYEQCFREAKKYNSKSEFRKFSGSAYSSALKNKWMPNYTWFVRPVPFNKKWTYETCYKEALKYQTKKEFQKKSSGAYSAAYDNKWLPDYTWFVKFSKPMGYWNYETCYEEAKKYESRGEFSVKCVSAYDVSRKNEWLDDYTWFVEKKKRNYWTYETCYKEALKYQTKKEFRENNSSAYSIAYKKKWMCNFTWLTNTLSSKKEYVVYYYKDEETNSIYVGLTNNIKRRHKEHCNGFLKHGVKTFDIVNKYFFSIGKKIPEPVILKKDIYAKEAQEFEKKYVNLYKEQGLNVLNLAKPGSLGGYGKWNYETCYEEAKKYESRGEFAVKCVGAYDVARKNEWLDDYTWFVELHHNWTEEECYKEALKHKTLKEFRKKSPSVYNIARKKKWLNQYTWLKKRFVWTEEKCYKEAKKYTSIIYFIKNASGAYQFAKKNKLLKNYTWFVKPVPSNKKWTYETCYKEALKYKTKKEFKDNNNSVYVITSRNGWLKDYAWLKRQSKNQYVKKS